ncbi:8416_t:CDS:2 [Diversispora eburnea]|uniref:8416_t:CDS:1 n=1 Tax=Diversispora eburnea TaxID=1213867 RepID=A0A9N8W7E8_9GLOM|nr:8416_t:CDS:2 [Diversispora eburnea]
MADQKNVPSPSCSSLITCSLSSEESILRNYVDDEELRQCAVEILHQNSKLTIHVITSAESPARTKLRMLR